MISDVLSDAIGEIREYEEKFPDAYDDIKDWIDRVVAEMEALRRYMDAVPDLGVKILPVWQFLYGPQEQLQDLARSILGIPPKE